MFPRVEGCVGTIPFFVKFGGVVTWDHEAFVRRELDVSRYEECAFPTSFKKEITTEFPDGKAGNLKE